MIVVSGECNGMRFYFSEFKTVRILRGEIVGRMGRTSNPSKKQATSKQREQDKLAGAGTSYYCTGIDHLCIDGSCSEGLERVGDTRAS
jgi:hypothetical protein